MAKHSYLKFLSIEIKKLVFEWPFAIILAFVVASSVALVAKGAELNELEKAVFGGIVSSFLFYLFIEFFPKVSTYRERVRRFSGELNKCISYGDHIFEKLKGEWPQLPVTIDSNSRFFHAVGTQSIQYQPTSQSLRSIKSTTNTQPIQFIYNNLGETLYSEYLRFRKKVAHLDRVAAAAQLEAWDIDSQLEISSILGNQSTAIPAIQNLAHINNNAALFGTDLDLVYDSLVKIQKRLNSKFHL